MVSLNMYILAYGFNIHQTFVYKFDAFTLQICGCTQNHSKDEHILTLGMFARMFDQIEKIHAYDSISSFETRKYRNLGMPNAIGNLCLAWTI